MAHPASVWKQRARYKVQALICASSFVTDRLRQQYTVQKYNIGIAKALQQYVDMEDILPQISAPTTAKEWMNQYKAPSCI